MLSNKIKSLIALTLIALIATACGGTSNTDVAVIVALTQTAAALQAPATSTVTAVPATEAPTSTSTAVPPTAMPAGYYPLTNDECTAVQNSLTGVLGVAPAVLNSAPFTDYSNNTSGTGCQLTYTGNGNNNFSTGPDAFLATGWADADRFGAGGARGFARGFEKDGAVCIYTFENGPADKSFCTPDMFFPDCMASLTPEQVLQTVTVSCARYQP